MGDAGAHGELAPVRLARPPLPRVLSFDCYGTLVEWEAGLREVFAEILARKGEQTLNISPERFRERWEDLQFQLIQGPYQPYRDILKRSLAQTLAAFDLPYEPLDGEALVAAMPTWGPFPEVPAALDWMRGGFKLAIITNTDNDIISQTVERIGVHFDSITTAMDAGAYKPSPKPFRLALERVAVDPADVLHIAFGFDYDIAPAQQLGCRTLWLNRKREPHAGTIVPDYTAENLGEIANALGL
jgi:2-haloacid dehalogenase